jgi:hypothetical protein
MGKKSDRLLERLEEGHRQAELYGKGDRNKRANFMWGWVESLLVVETACEVLKEVSNDPN